MRLIDSHAHLDDRAFDKDRAVLIAGLFADEVGVITIGADLNSSLEAVKLAQRHRHVWSTVGVHPHDAKTLNAEVLGQLKRLAGHERVVAIGEIGLDYYRDLSPRRVQREAFAAQLRLASAQGLPICLHNRESTDDLLAILRNHGEAHRGVVHSFLGGIALAETFLDLGLHLGVGGPLTFPKNAALREAIAAVPLHRILLETDCPYLTPAPHRGKRNEPAYVRYVAETIAELKGISCGEVALQTTSNTARVFNLSI